MEALWATSRPEVAAVGKHASQACCGAVANAARKPALTRPSEDCQRQRMRPARLAVVPTHSTAPQPKVAAATTTGHRAAKSSQNAEHAYTHARTHLHVPGGGATRKRSTLELSCH